MNIAVIGGEACDDLIAAALQNWRQANLLDHKYPDRTHQQDGHHAQIPNQSQNNHLDTEPFSIADPQKLCPPNLKRDG